jgi:hypothetical protein
MRSAASAPSRPAFAKTLAKAKTGFARARIMGGGAAPAGVPRFVRNWRATQNKTMNSYIIDITL